MNGTGRRERKRQQTADHLADTAWGLFQTQGYETVTMEAIAEAADVAKGTLYKYFPVKEALLRHRFHREMAETMPELLTQLSVLPTARERLLTFLNLIADWSMQHRQYIGPYLNLRMSEAGVPYDLVSPNRSGIEQVFSGFISEGQKSGEFRRDFDVTTSVHYLEFLYLASLMRWLNSSEIDLRDEFHIMLDLYLQGLNS
ncbi:MAG: TetR/AcrR family transcriptional regulator [Candidatus Thiodiazotropha sp.]|jgi:AcrR family transcriptional regulator